MQGSGFKAPSVYRILGATFLSGVGFFGSPYTPILDQVSSICMSRISLRIGFRVLGLRADNLTASDTEQDGIFLFSTAFSPRNEILFSPPKNG